MNEKRIRAATLIAPCIPMLFIVFAFPTPSTTWNFLIAALAFIFGYLGFFAVGYPVINLLRRINLLNIPMLMLSGFVSGILVFFLFWLFLEILLQSSSSFQLITAIFGGVLGLCVALCYGLIAGITWRTSVMPTKRDVLKRK